MADRLTLIFRHAVSLSHLDLGSQSSAFEDDNSSKILLNLPNKQKSLAKTLAKFSEKNLSEKIQQNSWQNIFFLNILPNI